VDLESGPTGGGRDITITATRLSKKLNSVGIHRVLVIGAESSRNVTTNDNEQRVDRLDTVLEEAYCTDEAQVPWPEGER
jgi:hypothetical protein